MVEQNFFRHFFKIKKTNSQIIELVEIEMRELLSDFGYDSDGAPLVCGSALRALQGDPSEHGTYR